MTQTKNVLIIGMDPHTIDFSQPGYMPGLTAEKVEAGIEAERGLLQEQGYSSSLCLLASGTMDLSALESSLETQHYDTIMIGAGLRVPPSNFTLFEQVINTVHRHAPGSSIAFNTNPMDTLAAVKRWA